MKCWHEGCNKKLEMGIRRVGICPEHGDVWEDDKPITAKLKVEVAKLLTKQAPDKIIAILLSKMSQVFGG